MIAPDTPLPEESVTEPLRTANACALASGGNDITLPPNRHTWATAQNCRSAGRVIGAPLMATRNVAGRANAAFRAMALRQAICGESDVQADTSESLARRWKFQPGVNETAHQPPVQPRSAVKGALGFDFANPITRPIVRLRSRPSFS